MSNMRPFQIILLAVFGLSALIGLVLFAAYGGGSSGKNAVGKVTIWGTLPQDAMDQGISAITQKDKNFKSVTYKQVPAATFDAALAEALAASVGPDLIIITQEQLLTEVPKIATVPFTSITQRNFINTYVPESSLFLGSAGIYGIPFVIDPLVLYYNQATLSSAAIALPPSTWEAVLGVTGRLTKQTSSQTITKSAIALGQYRNITNARAILSLLLLQAGNPITHQGDLGFAASLVQGATRSFGATPAESAVNFYTQFANPTKTTYSWNASLPESRKSFLAGDTAMYLGFASERQKLADANPHLSFDMAPAPQAASATQRISYGNLYAFAFPKASVNSSGAYKVAIALSDSSVLVPVSTLLSMAPAKRALLTPPADDPYAAVYYPEALSAAGWLSPSLMTTDRIFTDMIDAITTGRQDVEEALLSAEQSLNAALR